MLSKEDYKNYMDQILAVETKMLNTYKNCVDMLSDELLKKIFTDLYKSEMNHQNLVKEMKKILA